MFEWFKRKCSSAFSYAYEEVTEAFSILWSNKKTVACCAGMQTVGFSLDILQAALNYFAMSGLARDIHTGEGISPGTVVPLVLGSAILPISVAIEVAVSYSGYSVQRQMIESKLARKSPSYKAKDGCSSSILKLGLFVPPGAKCCSIGVNCAINYLTELLVILGESAGDDAIHASLICAAIGLRLIGAGTMIAGNRLSHSYSGIASSLSTICLRAEGKSI